jgi:hypothetical protein
MLEGATMADDNKEFWEQIRGKIRRALDLDPLCQEEAEKEYKRTKASAPLSETDINAIMEFAQSFGERGGMIAEPDQEEAEEDNDESSGEWVDPIKAEDMDAELMELVNRNRGEQDEETNELLDKHREEELGDDEEDGDDGDANDGKDTP